MKQIENIIKLLEDSLKEDGASTITQGNIILDGYDNTIDAYRSIVEESHNWLSLYQAKIIEETGISTIKIKFTNASGYFIEVSKGNVSKLPDNFIHKQTLVNAARFTTSELGEFQSKLFEAQNNMSEREYEVFQDIRKNVLTEYSQMKDIGRKTAFLDVMCSFSDVAYQKNYICPEITESYGLSVSGGRHAVIEGIEKDFVKNNLLLEQKDSIHVITGPNMGGKSTFLRQNAIIILMAHIGSFVPADAVKLGIVDKIFSRVGAHDNLFLGKSTFMVEMQEISHILNNATKKSFIIVDEVGRGTSTYDGMSLAWGILKHIHDNLGAKTLFATHYHEIIDESNSLKNVSNYSVAVGENEENLVFLRKVIPGGIKKSYGLEVAKIAGVSNDIIKEAKQMIARHELHPLSSQQLSFESVSDLKETSSLLEEYISSVNVEALTPLEALNILAEIKKLSRK